MLSANLPALEEIDFPIICKQVRGHIRYTQQEMAEFFGVSKATYINWELGKTVPSGKAAVWLYNTHKQMLLEMQQYKSL